MVFREDLSRGRLGVGSFFLGRVDFVSLDWSSGFWATDFFGRWDLRALGLGDREMGDTGLGFFFGGLEGRGIGWEGFFIFEFFIWKSSPRFLNGVEQVFG